MMRPSLENNPNIISLSPYFSRKVGRLRPPPPLPTCLHTFATAPICIPSISVLSPRPSLPQATPLPPPVTLAHHIHILLFTHSCTIPKNLLSLLSSFSIPPSDQHDLLCALAIHTVRSMHNIAILFLLDHHIRFIIIIDHDVIP